jgi:hypothetical protein
MAGEGKWIAKNVVRLEGKTIKQRTTMQNRFASMLVRFQPSAV